MGLLVILIHSQQAEGEMLAPLKQKALHMRMLPKAMFAKHAIFYVYEEKKKESSSDCFSHIKAIPALRRQRQPDLLEFEAIPVYKASSRDSQG